MPFTTTFDMAKCYTYATFNHSHSTLTDVRACARSHSWTYAKIMRFGLFKLVRFYRCHMHTIARARARTHTVISFRVQLANNLNLSLREREPVLRLFSRALIVFYSTVCMRFFWLNDVICIRCATLSQFFSSSCFSVCFLFFILVDT